MNTEQIEALARWSKPTEVATRNGPRVLRKARPTDAFSAAWRAAEQDLRGAGLAFSKNSYTGEWEICWWQKIDAAVIAKRAEAKDASRAVDADVVIPVPDGLAYLPFQKAGIAFASRRPSTLIADEMGLGKTIQAIGVVNADPAIGKILVICPATIRLNWQRELEKWLVRPMSIGIATPKALPDAAAIIINYDILHKHIEALSKIDFDLVVIDEAHFCKNKKARRSQQAYAAAKRGRRSLWLTGTPIVNRPVELLPILEAIGGEVIQRTGGGFRYLKRFCNAVQSRWGWDFSGASHLDELQNILRETCMVRRLKKDVLTELPAKRRQIIEIPANGSSGYVEAEQAAVRLHREQIEELQARVQLAKVSDDADDYRAAVDALRDGQRAMFNEISRLRHDTAVAKVPAVIAHLEDAIGEGEHKVVLFAHHHDVVNEVREHFGDRCVVLTGETPMADRQAAVDRFQADSNCSLFIGSITAAGVGITLTAASHVVFAELDWVPGNMSQAEDRCHRIGQTDSVLIQHLVLEGSLDAVMARTLVEKQDVIDLALDVERAKLLDEPVAPFTSAASRFSPEKLRAEAERMTPEQVNAVHYALRYLAGMCDGAQARDDMGFNGADTRIGHSLAEAPFLSPRQAALGKKIVLHYKNTQLPADTVRTIEGSPL